MSKKTEINITVIVDEEGCYSVGVNDGDAKEKYYEQWTDPICLRCLKLVLSMDAPKPHVINQPVPAEILDIRFGEMKPYEIDA